MPKGTRVPPKVIGTAKRWKALSHPVRAQILEYLADHERANSTALASALGESTGTTSYHLRVLAEAGVIERVETTSGRERWWQAVDTDLREPDYDNLTRADRAALDEWRAGQYPKEMQLVQRFIAEHRAYRGWAKASRASLYFTKDELDAFMDDYIDLLYRHGHPRAQAPVDARQMQVRMFYIPKSPPTSGRASR